MFKNMSLAAKLGLGFGVIALVTLVVGLIGRWGVGTLNGNLVEGAMCACRAFRRF